MALERNVFPTPEKLAEALAEAVAADLNAGLDRRGRAALAVSGGTTPVKFFEALGRREDVDWPSVFVTLVDERWVSEVSDRSNARLVKKTLLQGPAAGARFVPLYSSGDEPTLLNVEMSCRAFEEVPTPLDAVVLGMGNDGHTASFFPRGDSLSNALNAEGPVLALRAPGAAEPRVTLTLPQILNTGALYLHIEGEEKARTLDKAIETGPVETMPVRAVLSQSKVPVSLYWCP